MSPECLRQRPHQCLNRQHQRAALQQQPCRQQQHTRHCRQQQGHQRYCGVHLQRLEPRHQQQQPHQRLLDVNEHLLPVQQHQQHICCHNHHQQQHHQGLRRQCRHNLSNRSLEQYLCASRGLNDVAAGILFYLLLCLSSSSGLNSLQVSRDESSPTSRNFSTKVNFGDGNETQVDHQLQTSTVNEVRVR